MSRVGSQGERRRRPRFSASAAPPHCLGLDAASLALGFLTCTWETVGSLAHTVRMRPRWNKTWGMLVRSSGGWRRPRSSSAQMCALRERHFIHTSDLCLPRTGAWGAWLTRDGKCPPGPGPCPLTRASRKKKKKRETEKSEREKPKRKEIKGTGDLSLRRWLRDKDHPEKDTPQSSKPEQDVVGTEDGDLSSSCYSSSSLCLQPPHCLKHGLPQSVRHPRGTVYILGESDLVPHLGAAE